MKAIVTAGSLALLASSASAVTFLNAGDALENGGSTIDILADVYQFQDTFAQTLTAAETALPAADQPLLYPSGTGPYTLSFEFENTGATLATIVVSSATILQLGGGTFIGGASVDWTASGHNVVSASAGQTASGDVSFELAAGATDTLVLSFDGVQEFKGARPDIDFFVSTVPVPAGALLMGTALAGFGVASRRKKRKAA